MVRRGRSSRGGGGAERGPGDLGGARAAGPPRLGPGPWSGRRAATPWDAALRRPCALFGDMPCRGGSGGSRSRMAIKVIGLQKVVASLAGAGLGIGAQ